MYKDSKISFIEIFVFRFASPLAERLSTYGAGKYELAKRIQEPLHCYLRIQH